MRHLFISAALAAALAAACSPPPAPAPSTDTTLTATTAPAAAESFKRFQIGALNAVALRDGSLAMANDGHSFITGQTTQDVAALLTGAGLPTDQISFSIDPLYVDAGAHKLLFDTGVASGAPTGGQLPASLQAAGIDPASITDIFISHSHGDHINGLMTPAGALAFPNAAIHMSAAEWTHLRGLNAAQAEQRGIVNAQALIAAITPKVATFAPGAAIIANVVTAVDIKGHTPGHSGYLISAGDQSLLYTGDTVHSSVLSVQRPAWRTAFDENPALAAQSRVTFVAHAAESGQRLYAYHFPFPGVGKIDKQGDQTIWTPE